MERRSALDPSASIHVNSNFHLYDPTGSNSNSPAPTHHRQQQHHHPYGATLQHQEQQQVQQQPHSGSQPSFLDSGGPPFTLGGGGAMGPVGGPAPSPVNASQAPPPPPPPGAANMTSVGVLGPPGQVMAMAPPIDENYCLRWNDYEKKYAETFRVLRDDEYFTDVTLASEGVSVKAHRVILSACSNYFHAILKTMSPWQHPVLLLQDVKSQDLNSLMDFIYFGQVSVTQDSLQSFLKVAQKLKIKGLCETLAPPPPGPLPVPVVATGVHGHVGHPQTPPQVMAPPPVSHSRLTPQGSNQMAAMSPHGQMNQGPPLITSGAPIPSPGGGINTNFEGLLPRNPYIPEPSMVPLSGGQTVAAPSIAVARPPISTAPPAAHQSPRQIARVSVPLRASSESILHYSTPKRPKYASSMSPQSILRNQLSQMKDGGGGAGGPNNGSEIEVKSEPMPILATEVPSSAVTEFITTNDNDLALTTLGHGISPQFMFSPDPAAENAAGAVPVSNAPGASGVHHTGVPTSQVQLHGLNTHGNLNQPSGLITIDDKTVRLGDGNNAGHAGPSGPSTLPPHSVAVSVPVGVTSNSGSATPTQQQHTAQSTHQMHTHLHPPPPPPPQPVDEPQDLTPGPGQEQPPPSPGGNGANGGNLSLQSTPTSSANNSLVGSPSATPPKKDRNSRKTCGYCHKDFHEMSLKRHIKDVHFRSQNTYVICPQCCKQYASQNSLYSHLNRVHGVKKDMIQNMELQMVSGPSSDGSQAGGVPPQPGNGGTQQEGSSSGAPTPTPAGENHHDGIMDLAHHSDNSN